MRVILRQRIEKLGFMGDIVEVKPGYARNYLLPKGLADRATKEKIAFFEGQRKHLEAENLKLKEEAESLLDKIQGTEVEIVRSASDSGHLYGSVRSGDISEALALKNITLSKHQVKLEEPLKALGIHGCRVMLHPEVFATITVKIGRTEEEAALLTLDEKKEENEA